MKYILSSILCALAFFAPIKGLILITGSFVLTDTIFGIYVAYKTGGWKSFKSSKLFNLAVKNFFYMGSILLAYLIDVYIFESGIYEIQHLLAKIVTLFWVFIELKSIDENSVKIGNRPTLDIIQSFIKKAKTFKQDFNEIKK